MEQSHRFFFVKFKPSLLFSWNSYHFQVQEPIILSSTLLFLAYSRFDLFFIPTLVPIFTLDKRNGEHVHTYNVKSISSSSQTKEVEKSMNRQQRRKRPKGVVKEEAGDDE